VAKKPDSHDICFIADGDTRGWLGSRLGQRPGPIVDPAGTVLGAHSGAHGYTVGQRRGLGLKVPAADGSPRYVLSTDTRTNTVVVGPEELLGVDVIEGDHVRWCGPAPRGSVRLGAQLRAHGQEHPATAQVQVGDGIPERLTVHLDERVRGVAPGQSVVLYEATRVVGSATIARTGRS
jgi:tRNA-specific 2-thiouridylase